MLPDSVLSITFPMVCLLTRVSTKDCSWTILVRVVCSSLVTATFDVSTATTFAAADWVAAWAAVVMSLPSNAIVVTR